MLSYLAARNLSQEYVKYIFEAVCDNFGYMYLAKEGEAGQIQPNRYVGEGPNFPALGRVCYEIFSVTPNSKIVNAVLAEENFDCPEMLENIRHYLYTSQFLEAVKTLPAHISTDNGTYKPEMAGRDIQYVIDILYPDSSSQAKSKQTIDYLFDQVRVKISQISPTYNVYQISAGLSQIRLGLLRSALGKRPENKRLFKTNPGLSMAIYNDFVEWVATKMNLDTDRIDTVIMTKVMGQYINQYFLSWWFANRLPIHAAGEAVVIQGGEQLDTVDRLSVPVVHYVDVNIVDILQRLSRVSATLFQHTRASTKLQGFLHNQDAKNRKILEENFSVSYSQYTVLEYYVKLKLSAAMSRINSDYFSVTEGAHHEISSTVRAHFREKFVFNSDYSTNRLSNLPGIDVSNEFKSRMKISRCTLARVNHKRKYMNTDNLLNEIHGLAVEIMDVKAEAHDSDYNYLRYKQLFIKSTEDAKKYPDLPDFLISDSAYQKINDIIRCLCDLDMLDNALGRYGLSIIDMTTGDILEPATVESITCFEDLLSLIYQGNISKHSSMYDDMYSEAKDAPEDLKITNWVRVKITPQTLKERFLDPLSLRIIPEVGELNKDLPSSPGTLASAEDEVVEDRFKTEIRQVTTNSGNSLLPYLKPAADPVDMLTLSNFLRAFVGECIFLDHSAMDYTLTPGKYMAYKVDEFGNSVIDPDQIRANFSQEEDMRIARQITEFMSHTEISPMVRLYSAAYAYHRNEYFFCQQIVAALSSSNQSRICSGMFSGMECRIDEYASQIDNSFLGALDKACSPFSSKVEVYLKSSQFGQGIRREWNGSIAQGELKHFSEELSWDTFLTLGVFGIRKRTADAGGSTYIPEYSVVPLINGNPEPSSLVVIQMDPGFTNNLYSEQPQITYWAEDKGQQYPADIIKPYILESPFVDAYANLIHTGRDQYASLLASFFKVFFTGTTKRLLIDLFATPATPYKDMEYWYILDSIEAQVDLMMTYNTVRNELKRLYNDVYTVIAPQIQKYRQLVQFADDVEAQNFAERRAPGTANTYDNERIMYLDSLGPYLASLNDFFDSISRVIRYKGTGNYNKVAKELTAMGVNVYANINKINALEDKAYSEFMAEVLVATVESFMDIEMRDVVTLLSCFNKHKADIHQAVQDMTGVSSIQLIRKMEAFDPFQAYGDKLMRFTCTLPFQQRCLAESLNNVAHSKFKVFAGNKITQPLESGYNRHDPFLRHSTGQHVYGKWGDWILFPHESGVFVGINPNQTDPVVYSYTAIEQRDIEWR